MSRNKVGSTTHINQTCNTLIQALCTIDTDINVSLFHLTHALVSMFLATCYPISTILLPVLADVLNFSLFLSTHAFISTWFLCYLGALSTCNLPLIQKEIFSIIRTYIRSHFSPALNRKYILMQADTTRLNEIPRTKLQIFDSGWNHMILRSVGRRRQHRVHPLSPFSMLIIAFLEGSIAVN